MFSKKLRLRLGWLCVVGWIFPAFAYAAHPSIWLTPEVITFLKAKRAAGDPDWREIKEQADRYLTFTVAPYHHANCDANQICYSYLGHGWETPIKVLGIAYQVTGNIAYADHVIAIMDSANAPFKTDGSVEPASNDLGYPSRSAVLGLALAFDWVYDRLDETRKADTINTLNAWFDSMKSSAFERSGPAYGNYYSSHVLGFGAVGYATAGDNPRAGEIQNHVLGMFNNNVPAAFASGGFVGGYPVESFNYGPYQFMYLLQYMQFVKDNTGEDLGLASYATRMARNLLYNLKPNRWQATDEGDFPGDYSMVLPGFFPLILASILEGTTEGAWMQWMYSHLARPPRLAGNIQKPNLFTRLLYADSDRPSIDYGITEPTFHRSAGDEHVYVRSDWTDDAVWASFAAGASVWTGHEARKAGHIAIQRGSDYLLVNSGQWKGADGVSGFPWSFNLSSWRTNTLFFSDSGDYLYTDSAFLGGQAIWGANQVLSFDSGEHYVYSKAELAHAYDRMPGNRDPERKSLKSFVRSFAFLDDEYFVVWDRITALKSEYEKKLFWHFNPMGGIPTISGTLTQSTVGNSKLFLKTLLPANPVITAAADGAMSFSDSTPVTYRVEVSDNVSNTSFNSLHVIAATAKNEAFPNTTTVSTVSGNMVGALIADTIPRVVLFASDGTPQSSITYEADYPGVARHLIVDLDPGAYNVTKDGESIIPSASTTAVGVLSFESSGGAFSIEKQDTIAGRIEKVSGDLQIAGTGSTLPDLLIFRAVSSNGQALPNLGVNVSLTAGRAVLSSYKVRTDEDGLASVAVTLQGIAGPVVVQVSSLGLTEASATFNLAAVPDEHQESAPLISSVVNGGSFLPQKLSAGSIVSLFGENLASTILAAESLPLPTSLGGVSVQTSGISAPLFFVSPFQLNFQLPWELSGESAALITVNVDGKGSLPETVPLAEFSPGLFAMSFNESTQGAILIAQSGEVAAPVGSIPGRETRPARQGETVSVYCSGLGPVSNAPPSGVAAENGPLSVARTTPAVLIGGVRAPSSEGFFAGLAPGNVGLYQVNVTIPSGTPSGDAVPVFLDVGGTLSNAVTMAIQ